MADTLLYGELAGWFHLLTDPADYEEEAEMYTRLFLDQADGGVTSILELGSGGGNSASWLKGWFEMTLSDISPEMLEVSKTINPELQHVEGDMRTLRLDRTFDGVFVHDAVSYLTTRADLTAAIETAAVHTRPGGIALFIPDFVRERFHAHADHGGNDEPDGRRGMRYLEWFRDPDPSTETYTVDFAYLLQEGDEIRTVHDQHQCGAFPIEVWLERLSAAGFQPESVQIEPDSSVAGSMAFLGKRL